MPCSPTAISAAGSCARASVRRRPGRCSRAPLGLAVRLQRWRSSSWVVGMALTGISYGTVVSDIGDLIGDNSALEDMIAQGSGDLTETFLATTLLRWR